MKIYLVSDGEYSDRKIVAAFSSEKKAREFQELFRSDTSLYVNEEIEVFELDKFEKQISKNLKRYTVVMEKDGTVTNVFIGINVVDDKLEDISIYPEDLTLGWFELSCWAKDEKTAIKIANDKRAELIALGRWL